MVGELLARLATYGFASQRTSTRYSRSFDVLEARAPPRQVGNAGAVREHVADRDRALVVLLVARDVLGDRVVEREEPLLDQLVDDERGHALRRRVDGHRRVRRGGDLGRVLRVVGPVAAGVADRPVEDDLALAADADLDGRVDAGAVHRDRRLPDPLDAVGADRAAVGGPRRRSVVTESRSRGMLTRLRRSGTNGRRGTAGTGRGTYPLGGPFAALGQRNSTGSDRPLNLRDTSHKGRIWAMGETEASRLAAVCVAAARALWRPRRGR